MPLSHAEKPELICINHMQHKSVTTTMQRLPDYHALVSVDPPPKVNFKLGSGMPVRCYVCRVCGYVEMYATGVAERDLWKI
jgi:hypothetical protein